MAAEFTVTRATTDDALFLAPRLRAADRAEILAAGVDPQAALVDGIAGSTWAYSVRVNGEVAAIVGVAPMGLLLGETGVPWLLASDLALKHWRRLVITGPWWIDRMHDTYPNLVNMVHSRNRLAIKWLRYAGFTVHEPTIRMPTGELFHLFERTKNV